MADRERRGDPSDPVVVGLSVDLPKDSSHEFAEHGEVSDFALRVGHGDSRGRTEEVHATPVPCGDLGGIRSGITTSLWRRDDSLRPHLPKSATIGFRIGGHFT